MSWTSAWTPPTRVLAGGGDSGELAAEVVLRLDKGAVLPLERPMARRLLALDVVEEGRGGVDVGLALEAANGGAAVHGAADEALRRELLGGQGGVLRGEVGGERAA